MTLHRKIVFLILFISLSNSVKCQYKLKKWCINSDYKDVNGNIVNKDSCRTRPCVVSTCPYGQLVYKKECHQMADLGLDFSEILTLYKIESGKPVRTSNKLDNERFQIVNYVNKSAHIDDTCTIQFQTIQNNTGYFLENGSFFLLPDTMLPAGEYMVRFTTKSVDGKLYPKLRIKLASVDFDDADDILYNLIESGVRLVSCFFIILLLVVYTLCEELRNTPGVILMAYLTSFGISYLTVIIRDFSLIFNTLNTAGCYVMSVLLSFFVLNSFLWMSILSFNIWWKLRSMFYNYEGFGKGVDYRKIALYCCVAVAISTIYVVVEVCLNEFTESYSPRYKICGTGSSIWHLEAVLLPLQVLNWVLFFMTVYNLYRVHRSTQGYLNNVNSGSTGPAKQTAIIIIKLFMTMGINWFMEVLMNFFPEDIPASIQFAANIYNSLIGVILFMMNIMKANVLLKLFRKLKINNKITRHLERRVSKQHSYKSTSSQRSGSTSVVHSHPNPDHSGTVKPL